MISRPVEQVEGPYDAAFLPRLQMGFEPVKQSITEPVAKLGGEPVWLSEPSWPIHPQSHEPLVFIGQFPIPGDEIRLAYLFLHEEGMIMGGMDAEDGDGVLLIQPDGRIPPFAVIGPPGTHGRTLWRRGVDGSEIPVEFRVDLIRVSLEVERTVGDHAAWSSYMRGVGPCVEIPVENDLSDYLGGTPGYPNIEASVDKPWRFLFRIRDRVDIGEDFFLNFGYGYGFGYLSPDCREGRFYYETV
jgi:hypothetical protein